VHNTEAPLPSAVFPPEKDQSTRIMGVDPGLLATGFGIIEVSPRGFIQYRGSGAIRSRALPIPQRIQKIFHGLCGQIEKFSPHIMAIERPFIGKNMKSALLLGQARGIAILAAAEAGMRIYEYSPLEVKQAVVGYGRAAKEQVQRMICSLLKTPANLTPDAADALAVAVCFAHCLPREILMNTLQERFPHRRMGEGGKRNRLAYEGKG
jgi:crossover junction endodeoxyribonuclease RuvC